MFDFGWDQIALLTLVLAITAVAVVRHIRRPAIVRRIYAIQDELTRMAEQRGLSQDAEALARIELLYAEAARLLWQVGIDFHGALREIERKHTERRAVCRRLLEINEAFHRLALDPVDSEVVRREGELYGEAVCLLRQLDLELSGRM
jgi:hypothetical protein